MSTHLQTRMFPGKGQLQLLDDIDITRLVDRDCMDRSGKDMFAFAFDWLVLVANVSARVANDELDKLDKRYRD